MEVKLIKNLNEWENFNKKQKNTLFVQSINYGDFYKSLGESSYILGIYDEGNLIGGALILTTHAKRGDFLYIPYGPILPRDKKKEALDVFTKFLVDFAKEKKEYNFIRVSPYLDNTPENIQLFKSYNYKNAPMHVLAERTCVLDIQKDEESLLSGMGKNHRNLIRRCIREGVRVEKSKKIEDLEKFFELYKETADRHKFFKFSDDYVKQEFSEFAKQDEVMILNAYLPDGTLDASAVIMYYGSMAAYRHGASKGADKRLPSSYLLQWNAILEAKNRGLKYYNFWGIAPKNSPKHPFRGITHFKKGFGGDCTDLLHCQDFVLNKKYYINWIIESARKIKRGF